MEWIDVILYLLYLMLAGTAIVALWSFIVRQARSTKRGMVQNGIRMRILDSCVWAFVLLVAVIVAVCSHGDLVSVILITLLTLLLLSFIAVGWSMIKGR